MSVRSYRVATCDIDYISIQQSELVQSQTSIASTVLRMISVLLWFVALIVLLLVMGVDMNTVVVSGAAFLSAMTVSLSKVHVTSFTVNTLIDKR